MTVVRPIRSGLLLIRPSIPSRTSKAHKGARGRSYPPEQSAEPLGLPGPARSCGQDEPLAPVRQSGARAVSSRDDGDAGDEGRPPRGLCVPDEQEEANEEDEAEDDAKDAEREYLAVS